MKFECWKNLKLWCTISRGQCWDFWWTCTPGKWCAFSVRLFAEIVHHIVYLKWAFVVLEDCINTTVFVVEPTVWCSPAHRRCRWKRTTTVRLFFPQFFFNFLVRLFTLLDIDQLANAVDLVRDEKEWKVFLHEDNKSFKSIFKDLASWHFQKEDVKK